MTLREAFIKTTKTLKNAGIENSEVEATLLLSHVTGWKKEHIFAHPDEKLNNGTLRALEELIGRRLQGEPIQYITGKVEFFSLEFKVKRDVLIPRGDTEVVVEMAEEIFKKLNPRVFADVGTGCGNIGISLLKSFPESVCVGVDISEKALRVAVENSRIHGVENRFLPLKCDMLSAFRKGSLDAVVSNPPYVSEDEYTRLQKEVRDFEPEEALVGGRHGWEASLVLINQAHKALKKDGYLILETSPFIYRHVLQSCKAIFKVAYSVKDLSGNERVVVAGEKW